MKTKILIFSHFFKPHVGGVEDHVLQTAKRLAKSGFELKIITKKHDQALPDQEKIEGVEVERISWPQVKFLGLLILWFKLSWKLVIEGEIRKFDLIHIHDVFIWYLPFKLLFPKKEVILTMHGWEGQWPIPLKNIWLKKISAHLADYVICVGKYIQDHYQIKADQITYGGISQSDFIDQEEILDKHQQSINDIKVLYLGRLAKDTGLKMILQGLAEAEKEVELDIKFAGEGEMAKNCSNQGEMLGWIVGSNLNTLLRESQICFVSGYLSALKAMAAGCLVVAVADNKLKKDYWLNSPLANKIVVITSSQEISDFLADYERGKGKYLIKVQAGCNWSLHQLWDRLVSNYQHIYLSFLD